MATKTAKTWQEELATECRVRRIAEPVYNIVSDRRGGRTAWSATVTVEGQNIAARYWYDGQYLNNAKEDAAEGACARIKNPSIASPQASSGRRGFSSMEVGAAAEEEKEEPVEEPLPEGAIARVGDEILD